MDKLTELIQEAKPLYKKRKFQKKVLTTCFVLFIPILLTTGAVGLYNTGNEIYLSLEDNTLQQELIEDSMGLLR